MMETNSNNQTQSVSSNKMTDVKIKIDKLSLNREWLEKKIANDKKDLIKSIDEINSTCPIKIDKYWISLFNEINIEGTFKAVYDDVVALKTATVKAFLSSFDNSKETLDLLKRLADYELDLYSIIDESELTTAELSELFTDVLKDTNTKDEIVTQLFKQAKDRALRLKEKMDALRIEINDDISEINNAIMDLNFKVSSISKDNNRVNSKTMKYVVIGSSIAITLSLIGSILIHFYL